MSRTVLDPTNDKYLIKCRSELVERWVVPPELAGLGSEAVPESQREAQLSYFLEVDLAKLSSKCQKNHEVQTSIHLTLTSLPPAVSVLNGPMIIE